MLFRSQSSILRQFGRGASAESVSHGQADPAALFFGREVEVEDAGTDLVRDALAVVADPDIRPARVFGEADLEHAARSHGLGAVEHHVEQGLLQQIRIDPAVDGARRRLALDGNSARLEVGRSKHEHAGDDRRANPDP